MTMNHEERYTYAKEKYAKYGIDTDKAIEALKKVSVSLHCWQGDDVRGFDTDPNKPLTGAGWVCHLLFCAHIGASLMGSLPQYFIREFNTFTEHIYFPRGSAGK